MKIVLVFLAVLAILGVLVSIFIASRKRKSVSNINSSRRADDDYIDTSATDMFLMSAAVHDLMTPDSPLDSPSDTPDSTWDSGSSYDSGFDGGSDSSSVD